MTGYGKASATFGDKKINVEIKSLNSKAMDLSTRIAPLYREKEIEIRNMVSKSLERGKVDFSLWIEKEASTSAAQINIALAQSYDQQMQKLSEALGWGNYPNEYSMATLLRMPDIMSKDEIIELSEEEWEVVRQVVEEAIAHLVDFRKQEGAALEKKFNEKIDNIESSHPGYDEYRYDLDMIGHDPHELAAYLSAVLQGYTRQSAQAELERVFDAQYELTLTEEVEIRYRTETSTDPVTGETTTEEVPYEYYILNVKLTSKPISSVASELLTPEQLEMYQVYRQTLGNKPLIFGGGSADTSDSESLAGVEFVNGTRPGNQAVVDIAKSQVGNVGGQPYWSWYGFDSRVEWCACFVSWCYGQSGRTEPRFAGCQSQGVPWFQSHGQWGARGYENIAPGDAIFFDWDLDGSADHVGIVVGTDGSRVYTVEGNSGDACKIKSYDLNYQSIKGYGLMNW